MFGNLVQRLQSFSPLASPTTSPTTSPKPKRKFGFGKASRKRKDSSWWKEEVREVQSEPEFDYDSPKKDPRKASAPPAFQSAKGATLLQYLPKKSKVWQSDVYRSQGHLAGNHNNVPIHRRPQHGHWDSIYDVPAKIKKKVVDQLSSPVTSKEETSSKTLSRIEGIKEVDRLSEYEQYFASLLVDANHPKHSTDYSQISRSQQRIGQLLNRPDNEFSELERIQELFPNDDLKLFEINPISQKMKGLIRKRSTTAARLQRAFSAKGLRSPETNNNGGSRDGMCSPTGDTSSSSCAADDFSSGRSGESKPKRQFIMETPAHFTTGVQSQERHLFLFTDLLLVAKARSGGNFKLKEKVRVSEMWLANCLDDVVEVSKSSHTSFVVGWPTTNVVASFSCVATRDLWYNKLSQVISDEREKEPPSTTVQITHYDPVSSTDICKTVSITSTTTTRECISLVLSHLELPETDESKFQLWVRGPGEESPYPLIGHEYPFAIKMNCLRELLQECESEQCGTLYNTDVMGRCQFILRQERKPSHTGIIDNTLDNGKKVSKKAKKSPIRIHRVFRRSNSKGDITDGSSPQSGAGGVLFGQALEKICSPDGSPPKPIMDLLHQLFSKGPFTIGIFRKSANARLVRELKEKLDNGEEIENIDGVHITSIAALFKDFLRSLPDCLLCAELYEEWLELPRLTNARERVSRTLLLCSRLPRPHLILLQLFLCVLHHIAKRAAENMMSASNLAVCVGPSLLWPSSPILALSPEASKEAPATVEFLIERCAGVFGKDILYLLGDPPEQDPLKLDSGAEESDSLHSLHSGHSIHSSGGMRRDDSSIDSLERELMGEGELSPLPRKDKMSLTNLSRDSGLTMSDSQLYTPDEEESGSTSSSHSGGGEKNYPHHHHHGQHERSNNERFHHYTAPNNPNAIYTAVHRRQEKNAHIHYDEPDSYYASPSRQHTRVQITYSSPSYNHQGPRSSSPQKEYIRVYQERQNQYRDEDNIYSVPNRTPSHVLPFVANSNFQRHDWTRRCSNVRSKVVSRQNSGEGALVRSSSEESLLNKYNDLDYGISLGAAGHAGDDTVTAFYGTKENLLANYAESPKSEVTLSGRESPLRRSKSAHQIVGDNECRLTASSITPTKASFSPRSAGSKERRSSSWHRSRSTPHIHEEGDRSYDSSTLSDDDSTPHVSRSNSRGKEYGNGVLHTWDSGDSHRGSCNSSFKSQRTGSMCTVVSAGSTSTLSSNPPSYEETLSRRSLAHKSHRHISSTNGGVTPEFAIREEKIKCARAKQLYEESLRIYREENTYPSDLVRASPAHAHDSDDAERSAPPPPLPPKSDPPPLPPKQKLLRRSNEGSTRLKHLPPVHVEAIERKLRSVTSLPGASPPDNNTPPLHKTIIYTDDNPPPVLPPKERTIIEVEQTTTTTDKLRAVEKKSIETQTDDCDLMEEDLREESIQTPPPPPPHSWNSELFVPHVTSVKINCSSDGMSRHQPQVNDYRRRGRPRRRDSSCRRSRSMPGRGESIERQSDNSDEGEEWSPLPIYGGVSTKDLDCSSYGLRSLKQLDPDLQQEISWSVSQLRAIFGDTLKGAKVHPPPYRPPPSHRSPLSPYHIATSEYSTSRKQRPQSNYGEESYV